MRSYADDMDVVTGPALFGSDYVWELRSAEDGRVLRTGRSNIERGALLAGMAARRKRRAAIARRAK